MIKSIHTVLTFAMGLMAFVAYGQRGPGGVTKDLDDNKNCRLWLDAGDLNYADQTEVEAWVDRSTASPSAVIDLAFWDDTQNYLPPIFRNDPSNGINGKPVISFEDGGMLSIGTSTDLNSNTGAPTTYEQSIFMVFRTSNDVTSRQILWEEGGAARGFNIQILDGVVQIGAYDDLSDSDGVPKFGFTYKRLGVQPNTTYVLSLVYDVRTDNELLTNGNIASRPETGLTGTLNGQPFPLPMDWGGQEGGEAAVGGIATHPDPIGIGGLNRTSYNENGPIGSSTGNSIFKGRLAEICYYAFAVSQCQRVIIENYLAAKYFANVIANDKYDFQTSFGDDVIGLGKENNSDQHNVSQGDNLFEISVAMANAFPSASPYYLLVGHNNNPLSWTDDNVPDTLSFQRLRRTWRFDRRGLDDGEKEVHIEISENDLPALPTGFTKYGIIVDNSNGALPNLRSDNLQIIGLTEYVPGIYECDVDIEIGSYLAVAAIKPTVNFNISSKSVIEGDDEDPVIQENFLLRLNYTPSLLDSSTATIDITGGTANEGSDYTWSSATNLVKFIGGDNEETRQVTIVNDNVTDANAVEQFYVAITAVTGGLNIGQRDSITYKILDNDPPPKLTFSAADYLFNESDGTVKVPMEIIGDLSGFVSATADIIFSPTGNTALHNIDYIMVSPQVLSFTQSIPRDTVLITIINDELNEINETFGLEIQNASGIAFSDTLNISPTITILDNDNPPTVSFLATESEGYEGVGDPRIYVELSAPSSRQIVVPFRALETGSATRGGDGADYLAEENSSLIILPGDTLSFIYYDIETNENNLIVNSDNAPEGIEDAVFELLDNDTLANAQLGANTIHTYNIKDYVEFENRGIAGIGKGRDNTIVMIADEAINTSSVPNLSQRNIEIIQGNSNWQPALIDDTINGKKVLRFDGSDDYLNLGDPSTRGQSSLINTAGLYDGKSIFLVIRPQNAASSTPQTIYEQGAQERGLSLYIRNNRLYFQGWNSANDGAYSPWGHTSGNFAYAVSSENSIQNNQTYIISAHYVNNMIDNPADTSGFKLYINGLLDGYYSGNVGRLYAHGGLVAVGGVSQGSGFLDGPIITEVNDPAVRCYQGDIAEMIYYNEPNELNTLRMNEPRINIIHNHLSAKYNVELDSAVQYFNTSLNGDASTANYFGNDVAGIAEINSKIHGDARGKAEIRVTTPFYTGDGDFYAVWGHQGEQLTNTWPFSYWNAPIQNPIQERSGRIWKFFTNAGPGELTAQIEIDYSASDSADSIEPDEDQYLRLLIHTNSEPTNFSTLDAIWLPQASVLDGNTIIFTDVPITNGMYVSLGNTSSISNLPLPIELLSFDAKLKGTYVDLNWSTATEINNDYFVVERAGEDLIWEPVLEKAGAGNSNSFLSYSDKDRKPLNGFSYYRLKQVDFDGGFSYSDPVSIFNKTIVDSEDVFMYPNPSAMGSVFLRLPFVTRDFETIVRLFDMSGKQIYSERFDTSSELFEFRYGELKPGIYLVNIASDAINETKKLAIK
jgi:hypothetical protein